MKANFEKLKLNIYGESHSAKIGVVLGGVPVGTRLTLGELGRLLKLRKGGGLYATARREADEPILLSGLEKDGSELVVTGDIEIAFENKDVKAGDYNLNMPRPSHADYAAYMRDGVIKSGGGRFSGRMTAPLCAAGAIAEELLERMGVNILTYVASVGKLKLAGYADTPVGEMDRNRLNGAGFPCLFEGDAVKAEELLREVALIGDSIGGTVECVVTGLKAGALGDALFEGLEGKIAYSVYAVPAVKGVEFGDGRELAEMLGSEANDQMTVKDGEVAFLSDHSGGINGGICNGQPILIRVAVKPTPSIYLPQRTVDLGKMEEATLTIRGRHDSCIAPRAVAAVEAAVALALYDEALKYGK